MANDESRFIRIMRDIWRYLRGHHPWLRVASLVLALVLWVIISSTQNPIRTRRINVPYARIQVIGGETATRKLMLADDLAELLPRGVEVTIDVPQQNYARVTGENVTVTIDLSGQAQAGIATLPLNASVTGAAGTAAVTRVSPADITLDIDEHRTKTVTATLMIEGQPAEGFVAGDAQLEQGGDIVIEGPESLVSSIVSAGAELRIDGAAQTLRDTLEYQLYDINGNPVSRSNLSLSIESLQVTLPIYARRTVVVTPETYSLTFGRPNENYVLDRVEAIPNEFAVTALPGDIDDAARLIFPPVVIDGATETVRETVSIFQPVRGTVSPASFTIIAVIKERTRQRTFSGKTIEIEGLADAYEAELDLSAVDVVAVGPWTLASALRTADVRVYVDLSGYLPGIYSVPLTALYPDIESYEQTVFRTSGDTALTSIIVTVSEKAR